MAFCKRTLKRCYKTFILVITLGTLLVCGAICGLGILIYKDSDDSYQHWGKACSNAPCRNGGTCTLSGTTYTCTCPEGFIGKNCEKHDPCFEQICMNGGNCSISDGQFVCACPNKYSGVHCEHDKGPCDRNPCLNDGNCTQIGSSYRCACKRGFIGQDCDKVDPCQPNPCKNTGSCSVSDGNFQCECPPSQYGRVCERDIVEETDCQHAVSELKDQKTYVIIVMSFVCAVFVVIVVKVIIKIVCYCRNTKTSED